MLTTVGRVTGLPVVVTLVVSLLPGLATGQTRSPNPPRTPWGDPDLQGPWNNGTIVPLERPANLGERETLTDEEYRRKGRFLIHRSSPCSQDSPTEMQFSRLLPVSYAHRMWHA